jgi:two-component sensor histidine kinase
MYLLKNLLNTIILYGVASDKTEHERRRIKTVNLLNLIVAVFISIGIFNHFVLHTKMNFWPTLSFVVFAFISLYLSKINLTSLSFILFTLNVNLAILFINKCYPIETGCYVFYFPVIVSIVLLNKPTFRDKFALLHFSLVIIFFLVNLFVDIPAWRLEGVEASQVKVLLTANLIMSATLTGLLSGLMNRMISNQNNEITTRNVRLSKTQEELNVSLREKEVLLAELHHRVKNNLAIISGLLNMQEDATTNEEAKQIIYDTKTRISSMALVHKMLYEESNLKSINFTNYATELIDTLLNSYHLEKNVIFEKECEVVILPINKSIPLGLILNEAVTNCIKYVFKNATASSKGQLTLNIRQVNNLVTMIIQDNGKGFPKDYNKDQEHPSLGIFLIKTLSEQIDASVKFNNEGGAKIQLAFFPN